MISSQYEIKGDVQEKRLIIRKYVYIVFPGIHYLCLSGLQFFVLFCSVSEGSSLFGIKWLLVGDIFSSSFMPGECLLACDLSISFFVHLC